MCTWSLTCRRGCFGLACFVVMKGQIARMHRALSQFMLDLAGIRNSTAIAVPCRIWLIHDIRQGWHRLTAEIAGDVLFHTRPLEEEADSSNYA